MQDACPMWTKLNNFALHEVSQNVAQWILSARPVFGRSWVWFLSEAKQGLSCLLRKSSQPFFSCCGVPCVKFTKTKLKRDLFPPWWFSMTVEDSYYCTWSTMQLHAPPPPPPPQKKTPTESLAFSRHVWFLLIKTTANSKFSPRVVISSNSLLGLSLPWSLLSTHSARHCTRVFLIFSSNVTSQCCGRGDAGITDNSGTTSSNKPSMAVTCRRWAEGEKAYIVNMKLLKA